MFLNGKNRLKRFMLSTSQRDRVILTINRTILHMLIVNSLQLDFMSIVMTLIELYLQQYSNVYEYFMVKNFNMLFNKANVLTVE